MKGSPPLLWGTFAALAAAACLNAQPRPNGAYLASPLTLGYGYDDNFVAGGQKLSDQVSIVTSPFLTWKKTTHRTRFSMDYQPEFQMFSHHRDLNAWNHSGVVRMNHQISGRTSIEVGNYFLSTIDPTRTLDNSLLLLPIGSFLQNSLYAEVGYRYDRRTRFIFRGDTAVTRTSLSGEDAGKLNQVSAGASAAVERTIDAHHMVSANIGYLRVRPFNTSRYGGANGVELINGGYDYTPNRGLAIRLSGGLVHGAPTAFTGSAAIEKKVGGLWVAAAYRRYLNFFGDVTQTSAPTPDASFASGLAPDSIYQVVSVRAWGNLTKTLSLEVTGQRALIGLNEQRQEIKGGVAKVRLDQRLTNRLSLFAISEYYGQNLNEIAGMPMNRRRYVAGLSITLTRPPAVEKKPDRRGKASDDPRKDPELNPEER